MRPTTLPNAFQAELLDIIAEECIEVLQSLMTLREAPTTASGQTISAAAAWLSYSRTVLGAMPSSTPIARELAPAPKRNASNCRTRRMDSLCVGIPPLHRLRWQHWKPGHR